jgi:hypothetical protein
MKSARKDARVPRAAPITEQSEGSGASEGVAS